MFETLKAPEPDKIIRLMQAFRDDARVGKIDLGVGVYRNPAGQTPVMRAVKAAERRIWEEQESKAYVALAGDAGFHDAMRDLLLGDAVSKERLAFAATPGGTGAVRQALELVKMVRPGATVWLPAPTWPNHLAIVQTVGLQQREYRYYEFDTGALDRDGMMADLAQVAAGDLVLLHGCCHNPTGADLDVSDWERLADLIAARGATPFIDVAYQGFGAGLEEDAAGLRALVTRLPEALMAASGSKNFGLYRDRVGIVMAVGVDAGRAAALQGTLAWLNRQNFAFPPDHGARVVQTILADTELRRDWATELDGMRRGMADNRQALAAALRDATRSDRFGFLAQHRGMFSLLGLSPEQVAQLRDEHGIYLIDDSRLNIAGLTEATIPVVAEAVAKVAR
jgi:aspartate/tyrosine/aromatic aminotransferase